MSDRLLLWLVSFFPIALMAGVLFYARWKRLGRAPNRDIAGIVILLAALIGIGVWRLLKLETASTHVFIENPYVLLLAVPACVFLVWLQYYTLSGISRGRMWLAYLLRSAMVVLIALALAGLQMFIQRDALTVIFALDVSKSIPESERQRALDFIRKTRSLMKENDEAGLVVFGGLASAEKTPKAIFEVPPLNQLTSVIDPNATNIQRAFSTAASTFDESTRRRLIVFTDGRQTAGNALDELKRLVSQGIDVWIVPLKNGNTAEMLIEKITVPSELLWEQVFDAHVFVWSNVKSQVLVSLYPGDKAGTHAKISKLVDVVPGKNHVIFPGLQMHSGGAKEIHAVIEPRPEDDTLSENNEAYAFTDVQTESRVLLMTSDIKEVQDLLTQLEGEKIALDVRTPASLPNNPDEYRAYDCIILANLARGFLSNGHMEVIESCVKDQGAGLIMIGGDQSFGAGGYLGTPIENALPVNMQLKNIKAMPSGALCIVLHTCEFGEGNAWGKKITKAAINVLSPQDYAGVIDYEGMGGESWIFKPTQLTARKQWMFGLIDGSEPGDMVSLDRIFSMAVNELAKLQKVSKKHMIVITDADPQPPQPGTVAAAKNAGISISAVSIFPHGSADIAALKDVCSRTGGSYYSANDPKKLPQIFIKEAAVVRKSLIYPAEGGPPVPVLLGVPGPTLKDFGTHFPSVRAMVITEPKDLAELQLYAIHDGEKAPILSSWRYGLGTSFAFTSDSSKRWAPDWVSWQAYKKFWTNILRDASRKRMPSNHTVTTRIEDGKVHVVVEAFDKKGENINFSKLTGNAIDPKGPKGEEGNIHTLNFVMTDAGKYEAVFPAEKQGAIAITIVDQSDPRHPQSIVTGVANSYSAEFAHNENDDALLRDMGDFATTGGPIKFKESRLKDLTALSQKPLETGIFLHDLPPARQPSDLFKRLLIAAICLFPLDVAVRRLAIDPEKFFLWLYGYIEPLLLKLRLKKQQLQAAAVQALGGPSAPAPLPPQEIVPSGPMSRDAQSRYEQAGGSEAAQNMSLDPAAQAAQKKPVVGGTKLTPVEKAASAYTGALLKAKRRAKKE
jgi:uncharacterized membrane protein